MRQVARAYIYEACAELREDDGRWTNDGYAGERNGNRGGRDRSIVVEILCKGEY